MGDASSQIMMMIAVLAAIGGGVQFLLNKIADNTKRCDAANADLRKYMDHNLETQRNEFKTALYKAHERLDDIPEKFVRRDSLKVDIERIERALEDKTDLERIERKLENVDSFMQETAKTMAQISITLADIAKNSQVRRGVEISS